MTADKSKFSTCSFLPPEGHCFKIFRLCVTIFCIVSVLSPVASLQVYAYSESISDTDGRTHKRVGDKLPVAHVPPRDLPPPSILPPPPSLPAPVDKEQSLSKQVLELKEEESSSKLSAASTPLELKAISPERLRELAMLLPPMRKSDAAAKFQPISYLKQSPPKANVQTQEFPPQNSASDLPARPEQAKNVPLKVRRVSHQGQVSSVDVLKVSFSQPMVAISSPEQNDAVVPVRLFPAVPGAWHWYGAQTIAFQPKAKRFPNATTFKIEIPAGTHSINGGTLESNYSNTFSTPSPRVESFNLHSAYNTIADSLSPLMVFAFNQKIEAKKAVNFVSASINGKPLPLRLATEQEIRNYMKKQAASEQGAGGQKLTYLFCKAATILPRNTRVDLKVSPGVPSLEGPNVGHERQSFNFQTYPPLRLRTKLAEVRSVHAGGTASINFCNQLDSDICDLSMFKVFPAVKNLNVEIEGFSASLSGDFKLGTTYTVNLSSRIRDIYGQPLSGVHVFRFIVVPKPPKVYLPNEPIAQILPGPKPAYHVFTYNQPGVIVSVLSADVSDWKKFYAAYSHASVAPKELAQSLSSLKVLLKRKFDTRGTLEKWNDLAIDLSSYVKDGDSHFIVVVEAPGTQERFSQWIEYSSTRISTFNDRKTAYFLVTDANTGGAIPGADLVMLPGGARSLTDDHGLAKFALTDDQQHLVECRVRSGKLVRSTILPNYDAWSFTPQNGNFLVYQNTDRDLYRPGEKVHVNGLVRWTDYLKNCSLSVPSVPVEFSYVIKSSDQVEIARGSTRTDKYGVFAFEFPLPNAVELGEATINLTAKDSAKYIPQDHESTGDFQIQEFRRPEFEVTIDSDKSEMVLGDAAVIKAKGAYRTGAVMPHSKVHWLVKSQPSYFSCTDFSSFTFDSKCNRINFDSDNDRAQKTLDGVSGVNGIDSVSLRCSKLDFIEPVDLTVEPTLQDLNRQEWSASTSVRVHPASVYVGLKQKDETPLQPKTPKSFEFVVVNTEGKVQSDYAVQLVASREVTDSQDTVVQKDLQIIDEVSGAQPKTCTFNFTDPGQYYVTAKLTDRQGRQNQSKIAVEVVADQKTSLENNTVSDDSTDSAATATANKESYKPGDVAEIQIHVPFATGHGVLLAKGQFIAALIPFEVSNQKAVVSLPIKDTYYPQVTIDATVYGPNNVSANCSTDIVVPTEPVELSVSATAQASAYQPGQSVKLMVGLKDAQGKVVEGGQVALAVVDESILALTKYDWANPLETFYRNAAYQGDNDLSSNIVNQAEIKPDYDSFGSGLDAGQPPAALPPPPLPSGSASEDRKSAAIAPAESVQAEAGKETGSQSAPKVRSDFNPLAYFNPAIVTNADGTAEVNFTLPGNLTRYKIMAVAARNAGEFGLGTSTFTASLPLMVRPSVPRFLNYKDRCDLPFVVQNGTDKPLQAEMILRASNVTGEETKPQQADDSLYLSGKAFQIPANDRVEIRFPVAVKTAGSADLQVAVFADGSSDASELSIPLQAPLTSESFATYGQIDQGVVSHKIVAPANVIDSVGGLELTTSSTAMQQLSDAGVYLKDYPFSCSEQISSQLLGLGALSDLTSKFKTASNDASLKEVEALQNELVAQLCKRQQDDGGFGLWSREERSKYPYVSIQCARALYRCSKRGITVPSIVLEKSKSYLKHVEKLIPKYYGSSSTLSLVAYALSIRCEMGDVDAGAARHLVQDALAQYEKTRKSGVKGSVDASTASSKESAQAAGNLVLQEVLPRVMSLETMARLLPVLVHDRTANGKEVETIENLIAASIDETSSTASADDDTYGEDGYLLYYSANRQTAIVLESLLASQPQNDLIPKLVKGLLQTRRNGRWLNTQENAASLVALSKYFDVYEKDDPNFLAQFWLGENISFEQKFAGRSLNSNQMNIPMEYLQQHRQDDLLTLTKNGTGRLYYRIGMKCAPANLNLPATSRGFTISRSYTGVEAAGDVSRDPSGKLHVRPGATVRVTIKISNPGARYHVAMVDPFPAGFEPLNPALSGTRTVEENSSKSAESGDDSQIEPGDDLRYLWRSTWFDHQNFRDNRAEAFTTYLPGGTAEYTYFARATTPGVFTVPPCKVEEMYSPETFGRTTSEEIEIK